MTLWPGGSCIVPLADPWPLSTLLCSISLLSSCTYWPLAPPRTMGGALLQAFKKKKKEKRLGLTLL